MQEFLNVVFVIGLIFFLISWSRRGEENKRLKDREMSLLLEACEKGCGKSCFEIGKEYRWTEGYFGYNLDKALEYSLKGCEFGSYMACWQAGDLFSDKNCNGYNI